MKEKLIKPLSEVLAHPETYRLVWEVYRLGKLDEGLYMILGTGYKLFLHYEHGALFLTDNSYSTVSLQEEGRP